MSLPSVLLFCAVLVDAVDVAWTVCKDKFGILVARTFFLVTSVVVPVRRPEAPYAACCPLFCRSPWTALGRILVSPTCDLGSRAPVSHAQTRSVGS